MPPLLEDEQLALPEIGFDRFVRYHELKDFGVPFSRTYLNELEATGRFPKRVRLSRQTVAWRLSDLKRWGAERVAQSQKA